MKSLIGVWITCSVVVWSHNPALKKDVQIKADGVACLVTEDRLDRVGSPGWWKTPIFVDCSKSIMWLKPTSPKDGRFMFFKEDGDCEYE